MLPWAKTAITARIMSKMLKLHVEVPFSGNLHESSSLLWKKLRNVGVIHELYRIENPTEESESIVYAATVFHCLKDERVMEYLFAVEGFTPHLLVPVRHSNQVVVPIKPINSVARVS